MSGETTELQAPVEEPLRPLVATIVWGVIVLGIAALALTGELGLLDELPNGAVPIIIIAGLGALLVIGAIVGAITSSSRRDERGASGA